MLEAVEQALALGLHRPLEHLRVGQREIGRAHRVDEGPGREAHLLARRLVHPLDRVDRAEQPLGDQQIGLADRVEQRIVAPFRARRSAGRWSAFSASARARSPPPSAPPAALASARCQMPSPSVQSCACASINFAGSANRLIPGQAGAIFSACAGSAASAAFSAASPICCARCSIIICWARPITQVQCCMSSRLGVGKGGAAGGASVCVLGVGHEGSSSARSLENRRAAGKCRYRPALRRRIRLCYPPVSDRGVRAPGASVGRETCGTCCLRPRGPPCWRRRRWRGKAAWMGIGSAGRSTPADGQPDDRGETAPTSRARRCSARRRHRCRSSAPSSATAAATAADGAGPRRIRAADCSRVIGLRNRDARARPRSPSPTIRRASPPAPPRVQVLVR